jgi:hypothetical protein
MEKQKNVQSTIKLIVNILIIIVWNKNFNRLNIVISFILYNILRLPMESPLYYKQERRSVSPDIWMLHFNTLFVS